MESNYDKLLVLGLLGVICGLFLINLLIKIIDSIWFNNEPMVLNYYTQTIIEEEMKTETSAIYKIKLHDNEPRSFKEYLREFIKPSEKQHTIDLNTAFDLRNKLIKISNNHSCNKELPVDLVLDIQTFGGESGATHMICDMLDTFRERMGSNIYALVKSHAFSAGTFIALACDVIFMNNYAYLSKIDTYDNDLIVNHIGEPLSDTFRDKVIAEMAHDVKMMDKDNMERYIRPRHGRLTYNNIKKKMFESRLPHEFNFSKKDLIEMGVDVRNIPHTL